MFRTYVQWTFRERWDLNIKCNVQNLRSVNVHWTSPLNMKILRCYWTFSERSVNVHFWTLNIRRNLNVHWTFTERCVVIRVMKYNNEICKSVQIRFILNRHMGVLTTISTVWLLLKNSYLNLLSWYGIRFILSWPRIILQIRRGLSKTKICFRGDSTVGMAKPWSAGPYICTIG